MYNKQIQIIKQGNITLLCKCFCIECSVILIVRLSVLQFREDVNGLRAIAVLAVVLFHFNESWMSGGFVGVDVFFVISGFLMTGIILKGLKTNNFSLLGFYKSRIKRIVPALAVVCLFSLIYGFFFLYDVEFKDAVNQASAAMLFLSNFYFWKTASYFSAGAESKVLLHTWSLAVEWQFYMIYPIVLLAISKALGVKHVMWFILLGFILSLGVSVYASPKWATTSYFLLPTRVWQMLLGGLAYFINLKLNENKLNLISATGLALIILSCIFISEDDVWPGYLALIPCLGTFAILLGNPNFVVLKSKFMQVIGKYSYSIYLWHWVVVYMLYRYTDMDMVSIVVGIFLSLILGMFSYQLIEQNGLSRVNKIIILLTLILSASAYFVQDRSISDTLNNRIVTYYQNQDHNSALWEENLCTKEETCKQGGVFLWGDSHARALHYGFMNADVENFSMVTGRSCPPSVTFPDYKHSVRIACNKNNQLALKQIELKKPDTVVLVQRYKHEATDWKGISSKLKEFGVNNIIVLGPVPQYRISLPLLVARKYMNKEYINKSDMDEGIFESNTFMVQSNASEYQYVDLLSQFCSKAGCIFRTEPQDNRKLFNFDAGHLTNEGSEYIVNNFILNKL